MLICVSLSNESPINTVAGPASSIKCNKWHEERKRTKYRCLQWSHALGAPSIAIYSDPTPWSDDLENNPRELENIARARIQECPSTFLQKIVKLRPKYFSSLLKRLSIQCLHPIGNLCIYCLTYSVHLIKRNVFDVCTICDESALERIWSPAATASTIVCKGTDTD